MVQTAAGTKGIEMSKLNTLPTTYFQVHQTTNWRLMGIFAAHTPQGARHACAEELGYSDYAEMCDEFGRNNILHAAEIKSDEESLELRERMFNIHI